MDEQAALAVANALGGETWQSGGDIWVVMLRRPDGRVVAITDEVVAEYENEKAFEVAKPLSTILFS